MQVSVVIPAYNEEGSIEQVIGQACTALDDAGAEYEIIVVDDASIDTTGSSAREAGAKVIRNLRNLGYGESLRRGIGVAQYEYVVITDADGTYPLDRIPELLRHLDEGFDMVVGARHGKHYEGSVVKSISRWVFTRISEFTVGRRIPDINSGFRGFRKAAVVEALPFTCGGFSFTTSVTLIFFARYLAVKYIPIDYYKRQGESKVSYFRDTLRALQTITEVILQFNPLKMFLMLSFLPLAMMTACLVTAMFAGARPVLSHRALGMAVMSFLVAVLVWAMGLMSFTIQRNEGVRRRQQDNTPRADDGKIRE